MYKKGLRSMPRSIKKEVVRCFGDSFKSVEDIIPIIHPDSPWNMDDERNFVKELSEMDEMPSYWLISSKLEFEAIYIVFERKLNGFCEYQLNDSYLSCFLDSVSHSPYYGIY